MTARPIQLAPDLDPADAASIPRWLDELREVERVAEVWAVIRRARAERDKAEAALGSESNRITAHANKVWSIAADPNHARWPDG